MGSGWVADPQVTFTKIGRIAEFVPNIPKADAAQISVCGEDTTMGEQKVQHSNVRSKLAGGQRMKKIVALISETRKPEHMHTHEHCNRKPNRYITSVLFIQMV